MLVIIIVIIIIIIIIVIIIIIIIIIIITMLLVVAMQPTYGVWPDSYLGHHSLCETHSSTQTIIEYQSYPQMTSKLTTTLLCGELKQDTQRLLQGN